MKSNTTPFIAALLLATSIAPLAHAADPVNASTGVLSIAAAPLGSLQGHPLEAFLAVGLGASIIVYSIGEVTSTSSETIPVVIQNTKDGSKAVLQASAAVAKDVSLAAGDSIKVVAESTGHTLIAAGKILAFVPNTAGKALLHQSKLSK